MTGKEKWRERKREPWEREVELGRERRKEKKGERLS